MNEEYFNQYAKNLIKEIDSLKELINKKTEKLNIEVSKVEDDLNNMIKKFDKFGLTDKLK